MRHVTLGEVIALQQAIIDSTGGATGIREFNGLQSALAQPPRASAEPIFT